MDKMLVPPSLDPSAQALFLDYDGTLVEIAPTPEEARAGKELLQVLGRLQERLDGALAIVTGRPVSDIDMLLHPLQLTVAALHGLAVRRGDGSAMAAPVARSLLDPARKAFSIFAAEHPGTRIEDKGLSVALHFRGAPSAGRAADELAGMLAGARGGALRLQRGKMVVELLPAGADKGRAITALMVEPPFQSRQPVFVGDDVTDEAGFAAVNMQGGLSLRVGEGATAADFQLRDVAAVHSWLRRGLSA